MTILTSNTRFGIAKEHGRSQLMTEGRWFDFVTHVLHLLDSAQLHSRVSAPAARCGGERRRTIT